jgi:hypothetical protein
MAAASPQVIHQQAPPSSSPRLKPPVAGKPARHPVGCLAGAKTWVGLGIFAYNLQRMTVAAAR